MSARKGIALVGYFGAGNFGDDLILAWGLEQVLKIFPGEPIYLTRMGDRLPSTPDGVEWIDGKNLQTWSRVYAGTRGLLFPGGGIFQDASSWKSTAVYALHARLAQFRGSRVGAFGQSLTPFHSGFGEKLARWGKSPMDWIYYRDEKSLNQAKALLGHSTGLKPCLDPSYFLPVSPHKEKKKILGCNLRPWPGIEDRLPSFKEFFHQHSQDLGLSLKGFALQEEDLPLLEKLQLPEIEVYSPQIGWQAFANSLSEQSLACGMRFHFLLLSALHQVPFWCLNYDQKTSALTESFQQAVVFDFLTANSPIVAPTASLDELSGLLQKNLDSNHSQAEAITLEIQKDLKKWNLDQTSKDTVYWGQVGFASQSHERFAAVLESQTTPSQVITANPEMILLARKNQSFRTAFEAASYRTIDGVGLAWVLKKLKKGPVLPITGADFSAFLLDKWKDKGLFLLGSTPENIKAAAENLTGRGIKVAGYHHGFFKEGEDESIAKLIKESGAYWLLVGMGAPRQDVFLHRQLEKTGVQMAMGVGGVIDLLAGKAKRAPVFWQKIKLEWLYRLLTNPARWRRYLALFTFIPLGISGAYLKKPPFGPSVKG